MAIVSLGPGARSYHKLSSCPYVKRIKHYKSIPEGEALAQGYHRCNYCGGMRYYYQNIALYMTHEDKADRPQVYYGRGEDAVFVKTEGGFWKIIRNKKNNLMQLWHLSAFDPDLPVEKLMTRGFHRQSDVGETLKFGGLLSYICRHDSDKLRYGNDWRKMPKTTKQQRKFVKAAKNRERRKSIRNVYKLIDKISNGQL